MKKTSSRIGSYEELVKFISLDNLHNYLQHFKDLPQDMLNTVSIVHPQDETKRMFI